MQRNFFLLFCLFSLGLWGCGDTTGYQGREYPPAPQTRVIFHPEQAEDSCRVFAHVLAFMPSGFSGKEIAAAILAEARARGADTVLVGQARQGDDDSGPDFLYYGPREEYSCTDRWEGWKFGYDAWEKQGEWMGLGYKEWEQSKFRPDVPLVMQLAFLRCQ